MSKPKKGKGNERQRIGSLSHPRYRWLVALCCNNGNRYGRDFIAVCAQHLCDRCYDLLWNRVFLFFEVQILIAVAYSTFFVVFVIYVDFLDVA